LSTIALELPTRFRRLVNVLRTSSSGLLVLALFVGAGAAGFAVFFRWLIAILTRALTGYNDYTQHIGQPHPAFPSLGVWFLVLAPVVAGLIYGPLVHFFAREARGHGVPEVMFAVQKRGGRIAPQVAVVKALASALCIGGGGSVGREGPIVQIGSALGSTFGGLLRVTEPRRRVLVACGAAGGIAATFNAPLAGVFFAMELILADFTAEAFGMVVLASVTSSVIGRAILGDSPFLTLPSFQVTDAREFVYFALLGVIAGGVGVLFTKVLYWFEDAADAIWKGPEWLRPAVGGILLGLLLLVLPQMYGVGYPVLANGVNGQYVLWFLVVLVIGKIVATSLSIAIGGSGGVFAPSLFMGAMVGYGFGIIATHISPSVAGSPGAYALVGMGAVFAGAARAPITAVIIMFELTGEYSIILPLMTAIVIATMISRYLSPNTIYTAKLRRRGVIIGEDQPGVELLAQTITARDVMLPVPTSIKETMALSDVAVLIASSRNGVLPVTNEDGHYIGIVTARVVAEALADGRHDQSPASLVLESAATVKADAKLDKVIESLDLTGTAAIPVLDENGDGVIGWVDYARTLRALRGGPARPETTS
jgi:CIC family chloride channel protein